MCLSKILSFSIIFSILIQPLGLVTSVFAETVEMQYTDPDHLHAPSEVNGTTYLYDANGNLLNDGERTIEWNQDNKPIRITKGDQVVEFFYDASGRRTVKRSGDNKTVYVNQYYEQRTENNEQKATKHYFANGRIAQRTGDELVFLHHDHLGSTVLATDSNSQKLTDPLSYFPYGKSISNFQFPIFNYQFTGQEIDDGLGLYNYNARLYNPTTGVFISADSVVGGNRYAYAANNPIMFTDPTGHMFEAGGGGGNGDEEEGPYLPVIMRSAVSESPRRYFFASGFATVPIGLQKVRVDPARDLKLRTFVEKGVRKISQDMSQRDTPPTTQDVLSAVSWYVYSNTHYSSDLPAYFAKYLTYAGGGADIGGIIEGAHSRYVPVGDFIEGGLCFEMAILASVLLGNLDPTLDIKVGGGRLVFEEQGEGFFEIQRWLTGGYGHAWVEVNLPGNEEVIVVDPLQNVVLTREKYEVYGGISSVSPIGIRVWEYR